MIIRCCGLARVLRLVHCCVCGAHCSGGACVCCCATSKVACWLLLQVQKSIEAHGRLD